MPLGCHLRATRAGPLRRPASSAGLNTNQATYLWDSRPVAPLISAQDQRRPAVNVFNKSLFFFLVVAVYRYFSLNRPVRGSAGPQSIGLRCSKTGGEWTPKYRADRPTGRGRAKKKIWNVEALQFFSAPHAAQRASGPHGQCGLPARYAVQAPMARSAEVEAPGWQALKKIRVWTLVLLKYGDYQSANSPRHLAELDAQ